ncbi:hypothetical protein B0H17DRAFT_1058859 [Mycena rosella]|uniref:Uncharacterized protein n=1 Tax=Mycena rosella TaxID=1033263 RepID=A0AAD7DKH6_MYCRO|nr:hypothetical protein B0H17DRAFT_1058859 [Mycena rosella]
MRNQPISIFFVPAAKCGYELPVIGSKAQEETMVHFTPIQRPNERLCGRALSSLETGCHYARIIFATPRVAFVAAQAASHKRRWLNARKRRLRRKVFTRQRTHPHRRLAVYLGSHVVGACSCYYSVLNDTCRRWAVQRQRWECRYASLSRRRVSGCRSGSRRSRCSLSTGATLHSTTGMARIRYRNCLSATGAEFSVTRREMRDTSDSGEYGGTRAWNPFREAM